MEKMWKFIFNTHQLIFVKSHNNSLESVIPIIRQSGYPMFTFNGNVYRVPNKEKADPLSEPLGFCVKDIEGDAD